MRRSNVPQNHRLHSRRCKLAAGADFDESRAVVSDSANILGESDPTQILGLTLEVVHRFAESGNAVLTCNATSCPPFPCRTPGYEDLKIVAIREASLSDQPLG